MTPAINHPTLVRTIDSPQPHNPCGTFTQRQCTARAPQRSIPAASARLDTASHATLAEAEYVASPYCERCGTDEFIYLETFVPATHRRDGSVSKLGEVTYFCSGCDDFSAHAVPASWVPPGWYFG